MQFEIQDILHLSLHSAEHNTQLCRSYDVKNLQTAANTLHVNSTPPRSQIQQSLLKVWNQRSNIHSLINAQRRKISWLNFSSWAAASSSKQQQQAAQCLKVISCIRPAYSLSLVGEKHRRPKACFCISFTKAARPGRQSVRLLGVTRALLSGKCW